MAEHGWPARGTGGADAWQEATQTGPRGRPCGGPRGWQGAHGYSGALVTWGDGNAILRKGAPLFIRDLSRYFRRVGLCSHTVLTFSR